MKQHPLEPFILKMAENGEILDVSNVASCISGVTVFHGKGAIKGEKAYRVVAADVLGYMASAGRLDQHGEFGANPEDGGPYFTLHHG